MDRSPTRSVVLAPRLARGGRTRCSCNDSMSATSGGLLLSSAAGSSCRSAEWRCRSQGETPCRSLSPSWSHQPARNSQRCCLCTSEGRRYRPAGGREAQSVTGGGLQAEHGCVSACGSYLAGVDAALRVTSTQVVAVEHPVVPVAAVAEVEVEEVDLGLLQDLGGLGGRCSCERRAEWAPSAPGPFVGEALPEVSASCFQTARPHPSLWMHPHGVTRGFAFSFNPGQPCVLGTHISSPCVPSH